MAPNVEMQIITHRRIRGFIIKCLSFYNNEFINLELISDFVRECGIGATNNEVFEQVTYLKGKEYLTTVEKGDPQTGTKKVVIAEITPKGIDLIEENIGKDPGIIFPR